MVCLLVVVTWESRVHLKTFGRQRLQKMNKQPIVGKLYSTARWGNFNVYDDFHACSIIHKIDCQANVLVLERDLVECWGQANEMVKVVLCGSEIVGWIWWSSVEDEL